MGTEATDLGMAKHPLCRGMRCMLDPQLNDLLTLKLFGRRYYRVASYHLNIGYLTVDPLPCLPLMNRRRNLLVYEKQ